MITGDEITCPRFARLLLDGGVYAQHLDRALEVFAATGRELGVIVG